MILEIPLAAPSVRRRITALQIMQGSLTPAHQKVDSMSEDEYEEYTLEWVYGFLLPKYLKVRSFGGAGDKGRDVVGYYNDGRIDIYQCKHYDQQIAPTTLYPELGKLCYFTFIGIYPIPESYIIVAPKGCGPMLLDLLKTPNDLRTKLIENWDKYCKDKITKTQTVELKGAFKRYVEKFDFKIVSDIAPHELLDQHGKTQYHVLRFGGGLRRYREIIPQADAEIQTRELRYTTMLLQVYGQKLSTRIGNVELLKLASSHLYKHFGIQRNAFYSAESLEKFSRENFPDSDPLPFDELKEEAENVISTTLEIHADKPGYERLLMASQEVKRQAFASSPLAGEMKNLDKDGLCHHLVNEERVTWI
jgi:hypothetical protein